VPVIAGAKEEVLANSDGVVFVVDSQDARKDASIWAREQLEACIASQGRRLADMPLTLQYNKRDLPNALPVDVLDATHNTYRRPAFAAVAPTGEGVFDTLKDIALQVLGRLRAGTL
jgi:mutual gliding-motility protein MglA